MQTPVRQVSIALITFILVFGAGCNGPALQASTPLPTPLSESQPTAVNQNLSGTTPAGPPTPAYPVDWIKFTNTSPAFSIYGPPAWIVASTGEHFELHPPSGYAWVDLDWLSENNPALAGEALTSGADTNQLELALRENGTFGEPRTIKTAAGGTAWMIDGYYDRFEDNVLVAIITSGDNAIEFIGHQGDPSEDWDSQKVMYQTMVDSISF